MPVTLNKAGDAHARSLIAAGKVDRDSSWSFSAADGDKFLGDDGDDWAEYAKWFLAEDSGEKAETKARFKYPFGKSGKVYRRALIAIRSRASQQGATSIYEAAGTLLDLVDKKKNKGDGRGASEQANRAIPARGAIESRLADLKPDSYDADAHTVEAVLSVGAPVKRYFGSEVLEISPAAINLKRLDTCGVPLIDSHNIFGIGGALGTVQRAWIKDGKLLGLIRFDDSEAGQKAEGLVARRTVRGVSIGYRVDQWEITDDNGNVIDPERERLLWDEDYTFTAKRWELHEASLVTVPADPDAFVRAMPSELSVAALRAGASRVIERFGDAELIFEYPAAAAAVRESAAGLAVERMRARVAMLARQLALARSLAALAT